MAKSQNVPVVASFIETMDCLPVADVPEGPQWTYEIKLDGYRLEAVKTKGKVTVYSRRRNVLNKKFGYIADALIKVPDETVLDGEVVAMDDEGRSNFNLLQNFKSAALKIHYYAFDVLVYRGKLLTARPLSERREILAKILPRNDHISQSASGTSSSQMLKFVRSMDLRALSPSARTACTSQASGQGSGVNTG